MEKAEAKENYQKKLSQLAKEHQGILAKLSDTREIKEEKYVILK